MQQLVIRTTNKLSMMNPYLILFSLFAILCHSLAKAQEAEAAAAMHLAYDGRTTDKELLEAFVLVLDAPTKMSFRRCCSIIEISWLDRLFTRCVRRQATANESAACGSSAFR